MARPKTPPAVKEKKRTQALTAQAALAKKVVEKNEPRRLERWLRYTSDYDLPKGFQDKLDHVLRATEDGATPRQAANLGGFTLEELYGLLDAGAKGHSFYGQFFEDFLVMQGRARMTAMEKLKQRAEVCDESFKLYMEFLDEDFRSLEASKAAATGNAGGGPIQIQIQTNYD